MKVTESFIQGLFIIEGLKFQDERGDLIKPFSVNFFPNNLQNSLNIKFKETWFTRSHKNVIRAMHMQVGPKACEKFVAVINGKIRDVVLDLRKDSKTYKKWFEVELSDDNQLAIYIPKGCAHGYRVLLDNTITLYMATEVHDAANDVGIKWDSFYYDWGIDKPIISEKDRLLPNFKS